MDKLDQLISKLKEAKETLQKNVNESYSSDPNMVKEDKVNPSNPYGDQPKAGKGEKGRNDKNDKEPELESPENLKEKKQPKIEKDELEKAKIIDMKSRKVLADLPHKTTPRVATYGTRAPGEAKHEPGVTRIFPGGETGDEAPRTAKKSEKIEFSKSGQWSLKKDAADPKLAPKDVKVKELQGKIDSGTYKPDAGKIADAMLKPKK